jgi:hypothetical protein
MLPSEQGASRAAPVIHNHIVGKVALFDRFEGASTESSAQLSDTKLQHGTMRRLHNDTGVIHRPCSLVGVGSALVSFPSLA